jgi:hypothetical protein
MQKRAGLVRAIALASEVLLFDEPSAGLDPITSRLLDDLILELRNSLGGTVAAPPEQHRSRGGPRDSAEDVEIAVRLRIFPAVRSPLTSTLSPRAGRGRVPRILLASLPWRCRPG